MTIDERIQEISIRYPFEWGVVRDVYDVVKDFEATERILTHCAQIAISPYAVLNLLRENAREIKRKVEMEEFTRNMKSLLKELDEVGAAAKFLNTIEGPGPKLHPKKKKRK